MSRLRRSAKFLVERRPRNPRWLFLLLIPLLILAAMAFGPSGWREPAQRMLYLSWIFVAVPFAHIARKSLHHTADAKTAWQAAMEGNVAAAILVVATYILEAALFLGFSLAAHAAPVDVKTYVPKNAISLIPVLQQQEQAVWPSIKAPSYPAALVEQESCISLTHSKCWSTKAQLKTSREEGGGLSQLTRSWKADGALRFDALAEVKTLDPKGLQELNWTTLYTRADLNLRAVLDKVKDCHRKLQFLSPKMKTEDVFAQCDAAYNGGYGGLLSDRRLCSQTKGCDPDKWFGNVELTSLKSKEKWQGYGQSAFDINRSHVQYAWVIRRPKYMPYLGADRP